MPASATSPSDPAAGHRRRIAFVPAGVYLLVALAWSWPLPLHLTTRFTHDPGDPLLVTYLMWWNAQALPLTARWWNPPFFVPLHDALALTEHLAGLSPLSSMLQALGASPLTTYNLVLIASTWWCGLAMHALVRRLSGSRTAAYVGGLAFAYAPYHTSQLGHLQLYACWWIPLVLLALHGFYEDGRRRWLLLLGVSWLMQGLTNGYFLLFVPILIGLWLVWFTQVAEWRRLLPVAVALVLTLAAASPFLIKYYRVQSAHGLSRSRGEMVGYSATPASFVSGPPELAVWKTGEASSTELYLFPGVTATALLLVGGLVCRRDTRYWFYAMATVVLTWLAAGPGTPDGRAWLWHPYAWLAWLPGFSGLRVPARIYMFSVACLAAAAGLAFARLSARFSSPSARWLLAVITFAGLAADGAIAGMPLGVPPGRLVIPEANSRVLALPFRDDRTSVVAMYQSMTHRRPVINGYAGYVPSHADVIDWALHRRDPTVLAELRRGHPLYVLITATDEAGGWKDFISGLPGAELTGIQSGGPLYRLPALPYSPAAPRVLALPTSATTVAGEWLTLDLGSPKDTRALEIVTHGDLVRLPASLQIDVSADGSTWTRVFDDRPGGLALLGALDYPRTVPVRAGWAATKARYVRVNAGRFNPRVITAYGP